MSLRNELMERRKRILANSWLAIFPPVYMTIGELELCHNEHGVKFNPEKPLEKFQTFCGFPIVVSQ